VSDRSSNNVRRLTASRMNSARVNKYMDASLKPSMEFGPITGSFHDARLRRARRIRIAPSDASQCASSAALSSALSALFGVAANSQHLALPAGEGSYFGVAVANTNPVAGFRAGVHVPEHNVVVPWGVTESDLFALIPRTAFARSLGGWPTLHFTLLGVESVFAFNFVTHPEGRLVEVALSSGEERLRAADENWFRREFTRLSRLLRRAMGKPNWIDLPRSRHLRWGNWRLWVDLAVERGYYSLLGGEFTDCRLQVFAKFALPRRGQ
jgi:hypothetical protein